jgi:hypothetical protein
MPSLDLPGDRLGPGLYQYGGDFQDGLVLIVACRLLRIAAWRFRQNFQSNFDGLDLGGRATKASAIDLWPLRSELQQLRRLLQGH